MDNDINKDGNKRADESNTIISASEDRIKLTLRRYTDITHAKTGFWTWLGFYFSFLMTLVTAEFQDFLGINAMIIQTVFVVLLIISAIVTVVKGIKLIIWKDRDRGDEEWFLLELQGKKKTPKEKIQIDSFDLKYRIGLLLKVLVYIVPIILWVIIMCFIGWGNAWSREIIVIDELQIYPWLLSLICSLAWYVITYMVLISESEKINEWFDKTFFGGW